MKIEVRCDACRRGFLVDERTTADELSCPACLAPISIDAEPAVLAPLVESPPVEARPTEAAPTPGISEPPAALAPAATATGSASAVVCPRCKLHFDPASKLARQQRPEGPRSRVLIVEDLEYFRQLATDALSTRYEVVLAQSVDEARKALAAQPIQLILVDLDLDEGGDGLALLRGLQPKPCPIVIFTAQDESEMYGERWEELRRLGADDVVIKGMRVAESLQRKVDAILGTVTDDL